MWWLFLWPCVVATTGGSPSYVVERRSIAPGRLLSSPAVRSLKDCTDRCSQTANCTGFNFLIDATKSAHCLLMDSSNPAAAGGESEKVLAEAVLFSGRLFDLNGDCGGKKRSFSFERWPNRQLKLNNSILEEVEGIKLADCLRKCQEREGCLSAIFSPTRCILSTISPNTVYSTRMHFEYSDEADLYENNCRGNDISNFDSQCTWMRIKSAGLPDQWDTKERTEDVEECERLCLVRDRDGDPCRSYTFDSTSGYCYQSTISARLSGRSALEFHEARYTHGDLDDCTDFSLHCQETGLELRGSSIRRFSGFIRTKEGKTLVCNKPVDGTYEFSIKMGFEECGFRKFDTPFPSYKGVVHVKEGSTPLITIRDKILQVECRLHDQMAAEQQTIAVAMMVEEGNRTDKILSNKVFMVPSKAPPLPKYSLRVLDTDGSQSETVKYGDHGWIQITMNQKEVGSSFSVSKLEARDMKTNHRLALLDDEGCVTNGSLVERITRPRDSEMNVLVNYEFFDQGAEIVFFAYAQTCTGNCDPKCNEGYFEDRKHIVSSSSISMRTKRAISERALELSQDLYPLHGGRVMLLRSSDSKVPPLGMADTVEQVEVEQPSWGDILLQCIFNDSTCLFSFTLASLQFSLLIMCFIVMYCYVRQYRHYRALNSQEPTPTRIQQTKY